MQTAQASFMDACTTVNIPAIQLLLEQADVDPNQRDSRGWTALSCACRFGHHEVVECLLRDPRVDPSPMDVGIWTPLSAACYDGHTEIVKLLLRDPRVDPNRSGTPHWPPLCASVRSGNLEVLRCLLRDPRIDPNQRDNGGSWTVLHYAIRYGHLSSVKAILASRPHICTDMAVSVEGGPNTATELARRCGLEEAVRLLEDYALNPQETRRKLCMELGNLFSFSLPLPSCLAFPDLVLSKKVGVLRAPSCLPRPSSCATVSWTLEECELATKQEIKTCCVCSSPWWGGTQRRSRVMPACARSWPAASSCA